MAENNLETTKTWTEEQLGVLASLGLTSDDADRTLEVMASNRKDKRLEQGVCICGHSANRHKHSSTLGKVICRVNIRQCHCARFTGVIRPSNLNPFARVSEGNKEDHALVKGIIGLMESGGSFTWIEGRHVCFHCGVDDETIYPVIVDYNWRPALPDKDYITDRADVLLCASCDNHLQSQGKLPQIEK